MEIIKRTNDHLYPPDEQAVICQETKIGIKRRARDSQDSSHHIVGESLLTVSDGTGAILPKLDRLKRTLQRGVSGCSSWQLWCSLHVWRSWCYQQSNSKEPRGSSSSSTTLDLKGRGFSSSGHSATWRCCGCPSTGWLKALCRRLHSSSPRCVCAACFPGGPQVVRAACKAAACTLRHTFGVMRKKQQLTSVSGHTSSKLLITAFSKSKSISLG